MATGLSPDDKKVLLKIQNSRKPDQIIFLTLKEPNGYFETWGLRHYFNVDEICLESADVVRALPEFAEVLSFLFETMSDAQDLRLPFTYQNDFQFHGIAYTLHKREACRVLKRVNPDDN